MTEDERRQHRDYMREYIKRAPQKVLDKKREREYEWRRNNADKVKKNKRIWFQANKDRLAEQRRTPEGKAKTKEFRQSALGIANHKRGKARGKGAIISDLTLEQWQTVLLTFDNCCAYCNSAETKLEQEHIVPLSRGGHHTKDNVVPACRKCNLTKGSRTADEWALDIKVAAKLAYYNGL